MAAATVKRGFEGQVFIGTAGSQAATQLVERTDITYNLTNETADSTAAGDGTSVPLKTEEVVAIAAEISWSMLYKTEDTNIATMIDAMKAGTAVAVRIRRHSTDTRAFDGDCFLDFGSGMPLSDNQKFEITAKPTRRHRVPVFG
jgi:hypothetical protein